MSNRHLHSFPTRRSSDLGFAVMPVDELGSLVGMAVAAQNQVNAVRFQNWHRVLAHVDQVPFGVRVMRTPAVRWMMPKRDRKSTRLNSSHLGISYAVFCLK